MKPNVVLSLISFVSAALLAYLFYSIADEESKLLNALAISGFISLAICLELGLGVEWENARYKVNAFAVSILFLITFIVEHCCFAIWGTNQSFLIITTGLLLLIYILIIYAISKTKL